MRKALAKIFNLHSSISNLSGFQQTIDLLACIFPKKIIKKQPDNLVIMTGFFRKTFGTHFFEIRSIIFDDLLYTINTK
jgi:hypothetical protein